VPPQHLNFKGNWYPGLNGVRAIAVLLVFTVHLIPKWTLYFGWSGVLIFFVLSGFLITGILFDNRNKPHRWRNFYSRRTLRIFPLFYFVWLVIAILTPIVHLQWYPLHALWPLYLGNYVRFLHGDLARDHIYSAGLEHAAEIGHFWSLAVEEQFYLVWPLVVFFVSDRRRLIRICQVMIVAVLLLRIILAHVVPAHILAMELLYRVTITQADAFMIGGMLALWLRGPERERLMRWSTPLLAGALACFAVMKLVHLHSEGPDIYSYTPWVTTWGFTVLDLASAGLILCAMKPGHIVYRICTIPFVSRLGLYSYGFYVYHVLLLPLVAAFELHPSAANHSVWRHAYGFIDFGLQFAVVFGVSALSYHFLEMPFLSLKERFAEIHRNPEAAPLP
jgi:peptidoglycan/LPS O-acetylase OafA/YrhL